MSCQGPESGNPYVEVKFGATFEQSGRALEVTGFYDRARPTVCALCRDMVGAWTYRTRSNGPQLDAVTGSFEVIPARAANHGTVRVKDEYHFVYADGTPYREMGTTCYAWTSQPVELEENTVKDVGGVAVQRVANVRVSKVVQLQP